MEKLLVISIIITNDPPPPESNLLFVTKCDLHFHTKYFSQLFIGIIDVAYILTLPPEYSCHKDCLHTFSLNTTLFIFSPAAGG